MLFVMQSYLIEVRGLKQCLCVHRSSIVQSYLIEVRGLKHPAMLTLVVDIGRTL